MQSFQQSDAFGMSVQWSGLDNFAALWRDDTYLESFKTTALFSVLVAGLGISLSLVLAFFADRVVRGIWLYRSLLILPYAVAPVVAGVLWLFLFSPSVGLVAYVLDKCGISWNILLNSAHAMTLIVIASVWKQISYNFLFFLAGFQSIPKSLVEAAAIDGASVWQRFWTVQLPLLTPTLFFLLVVNTVYAFFETFGIVDATTRGGPGKDTAILVYKVYFDGFKAMDLGGLPEQLGLKLLEPLRELFKDEVRELGVALGLPFHMVYRHPFPGPGLGVRILGEVKKEFADLLRRADAIFIEELRNFIDEESGKSWYDLTSQAFAVFLPVKSVGVMGDGRTYDYVVALCAVQTSDFMTADWAELPYALLKKVSGRIINEVRGINRVTYDVSSKPPATIEWG